MLEKKTIARPYAQAAFEQANEEDSLEKWSDLLTFLAKVTSDGQMQGLMHDPRVSSEQLNKLLLDLAGDSLNKTMANFVSLLSESDRLILSPEISQLFEERKAEAEKHANVHVISAFEMDSEEKKKVAGVMSEKLGRSVEVTTELDPDLIGGMVVKSGDMVVDLSVRGRLNTMANEFK
ncbi:MAG: F0F1 ATP synthase subunit delta [Gammaproteobacteria bacterium]